jgi:hypothetical protein
MMQRKEASAAVSQSPHHRGFREKEKEVITIAVAARTDLYDKR